MSALDVLLGNCDVALRASITPRAAFCNCELSQEISQEISQEECPSRFRFRVAQPIFRLFNPAPYASPAGSGS